MTTGRDGTANPDAGGPARHIPVLLDHVTAALRPAPGMTIVDATFGAGGYSRALLDAGASVIAVDRDPTAIVTARALADEHPGRVEPLLTPFGALAEALAERAGAVDGVVMDIGVSSMQIDTPERGFSFQKDGPLDMRMGDHGPTAADLVNTLAPADLTRVIGLYGEERQAGRVSRAIVERRAERPFERTLDLAGVVGRVIRRKPQDKIDPATRTFQALRIAVNDELGELARALVAAEGLLKPGGRLVVVSFHSLEDRIVKRFLRERSSPPGGSRHMPDLAALAPTFDARNRASAADDAEAEANPRARSAKLRLGVRTDAPPRNDADPLAFAALPDLPLHIEARNP